MFRCIGILMIVTSLPCIARSQTISTYAGTGTIGNTGDGGAASAASLNYPSGIAFDKNGNLYVALGNSGHKVRRISPSGIITTIAGTGIPGYSGDGTQATNAQLRNPLNVALDTADNLYISDAGNHVIRKVHKETGLITTIAGTGTAGYSGDGGAAAAAMLNTPNGICFDKLNNLYFGDNGNYRVRKINNSGIISLVAGDGSVGYGGDGAPANTSAIYGAFGLCTDKKNEIYISDGYSRVYKINESGIISTFAGSAIPGSTGDGGAATIAQTYPLRIAFDQIGNLFIAENSPHNKVRVVDTFGIIHTAAGDGTPTFGGDGGPATSASIFYPSGVAVDGCGNLFISDLNNRRIRKVAYPPVLTIPNIAITSGTTVPIGSPVTVTATVTNAGSSYLVHWMNRGVEFASTTVPVVTYTKGAGIDTITARVVSTATYGCYDSATSAPHVVNVGTTGLASLQSGDGSVSVYPNPASSSLSIYAPEGISNVTVTNLLGQEVAAPASGAKGSPEWQLSTGHLPSGTYLARINNRWVRRFVKE